MWQTHVLHDRVFHREHAKHHVWQRIPNEGCKRIESDFFSRHTTRCGRHSYNKNMDVSTWCYICIYIVVFGSVFSLFCWRFARGSWSWWCDASRGIGRCGAVFFHYATGVDLEFTLRSADVVEKQEGLDQKLGVFGDIIQGTGLPTPFFCHP